MIKKMLPKEITRIKFKERPEPVPYNYRISYKVAQLCLILYMIKRGGCSYIKLQMISIALSSEYDMVQLLAFIKGDLPDYSIIAYDPSVNSALLYAKAEGLIIVQSSNNKLRLSEKGKKFADTIYNEENIMVNEKNRLKEIIDKISEEAIAQLVKSWGEI